MRDILSLVFTRLSWSDQVNFTKVSSSFFADFKISRIDSRKLTQERLDARSVKDKYLWKNITSINLSNNRGVTNIDRLQDTLRVLDISDFSFIHDVDKLIKLKILNISRNYKISRVPASLISLNCSSSSLPQEALTILKRLVKINVSHNEDIVDLMILPNLKILIAEDSQRNINNKTIENLALRELYISGNIYINNVLPLRKTLRILDISYNQNGRCGVTQRGIQDGAQHVQLVELNANNNYFITDVSFMVDTLKVLKCEGMCGIRK